MSVRVSLNGSYPRGAGLARLYSRLHSGRVSRDGFERGVRAYTLKLLKLLRGAGVTVFTDGMLRWDDILNPLIGFVEGVEVNGLVRFFDNNFFVRVPVVRGDLRIAEGNPIPKWFETSLRVAEEVFGSDPFTLKQPLPGPITLAEFSVNRHYSSYWALIREWREGVLEPLIRSLAVKGLKVVELHEPYLTWPGLRRGRLAGAVAELAELLSFCRDLDVDAWVLTYFGYLGRVGKHLSKLSDAVVGIDLHVRRSRKAPHRLIKDYGLRRVALGLLDARNTRVEREREVRSAVKAALRAGAEEVYVGNNAPLDFLPEPIAARKLRRIGKAVSKFFKGGE